MCAIAHPHSPWRPHFTNESADSQSSRRGVCLNKSSLDGPGPPFRALSSQALLTGSRSCCKGAGRGCGAADLEEETLGPLRAPPSGAALTAPSNRPPPVSCRRPPPGAGKSPFSHRHVLGKGPAVCPRRAWGAQPTLSTAGPELDRRWARGRRVQSSEPRVCRSVVHNCKFYKDF